MNGEGKKNGSELFVVVRPPVSYLLTPVSPPTFDLLATGSGVSEVQINGGRRSGR